MKRILIRVVLGVVLVAVAAVGYLLYRIGPSNVWGMMRYDQRREGDLKVGDRAPDVALTALDGTGVRLSEQIGSKPLILIFGSYT